MEKITYEVRGYAYQEDYDNRNYIILDEYIPTKVEAMAIGNDYLGEYEVIKVQSNDREEIFILKVA